MLIAFRLRSPFRLLLSMEMLHSFIHSFSNSHRIYAAYEALGTENSRKNRPVTIPDPRAYISGDEADQKKEANVLSASRGTYTVKRAEVITDLMWGPIKLGGWRRLL